MRTKTKSNRIMFCAIVVLTLLQFVWTEGLGADKPSEFLQVVRGR